MVFWLGLLVLHCFHSSIALPTEIETKRPDVRLDQLRSSEIYNADEGVVAHEIAPRVQDPTENLLCRIFKLKVPRGMVMALRNPGLLHRFKYLITPASVGSREIIYSPAMYAALCVSPEKPKPFPLLFAPSPPLVSSPAAVAVPKPPDISKAPTVASDRPMSVLSSPAPAISLVFNTPVGSIGLGSTTSPAVNIGTQSIADTEPTWLIRRIMLPYV